MLSLEDLIRKPVSRSVDRPRPGTGIIENSILRSQSDGSRRTRSSYRVSGLDKKLSPSDTIEYDPSVLEPDRKIVVGRCERQAQKQRLTSSKKVSRRQRNPAAIPKHVVAANAKWRRLGYAMGMIAFKPPQPRKRQANLKGSENLVSRIIQFKKGTPEMIGDTGATFHMVGKKYVTKQALAEAIRLHTPEEVSTASGDITVTEALPVNMSKIALKIKSLLLEDEIQPIMSIGQMVIKEGFDFVWRTGGQLPYLEDPKRGIRIVFHVRRYVPHLDLNDPRSFRRIQKNLNAVSVTSGLNGKKGGKAAAYAAHAENAENSTNGVNSESSTAHASVPPTARKSSENEVPDEEEEEDPEADTDIECEDSAEVDAQTAKFCGKYTKARLLAEARSIKHQLNHHPKNPYCRVCREAKATRAPARKVDKRHAKGDEAPKQFGEKCAGDIIIDRKRDRSSSSSASSDSRPTAEDGSFMGFNLIDYYSDWTSVHPIKTRKTDEIVKGMKDFEGPLTGPRVKQITKLT